MVLIHIVLASGAAVNSLQILWVRKLFDVDDGLCVNELAQILKLQVLAHIAVLFELLISSVFP